MKHQRIRTVRLGDDELDKLLDRLDASSSQADESKRRAKRYAYRLKKCAVHIQQPGDNGTKAFSVPTRNLSAGGVSFVHGGFLHIGTRCVMQLTSLHGTWEFCKGTVVGCNHVEGSIHEIHVIFEEPIDVGSYCPESLQFRVLVVEDDAIQAKLCAVLLEKLNAIVEIAPDGEQAVEKAMGHVFDLILMDFELPEMSGTQTTKALRDRGYDGRIVALTAKTRPEVRQAFVDAGGDDFVAKPYGLNDIEKLLNALRQEPLFSSLAGDDALVDLINGFVNKLNATVRDIQKALAASDPEHLESLCRTLKAESGGYGFEPISDAAESIERAVQEEKPRAELTTLVDALVKWCRLARKVGRACDPNA